MAIEGKAASCRSQDQGPLNPSAPRVACLVQAMLVALAAPLRVSGQAASHPAVSGQFAVGLCVRARTRAWLLRHFRLAHLPTSLALICPGLELWNLRLRGPTPYPLGQQTSWCFASSSYHRSTYANRAAERQCIGCSGIAQACSLAHFAGFDLPRTRAWNLRLRGPTPYPQASRPGGAPRAGHITAVPTRIDQQSGSALAPPALLRLAHLPTSLALICPGLEPGISGRLHDQALPREQMLAAQCSRGKNGRVTDGGIQAMAIEGKAASCRPQDQGPLNPNAPRVVPSPSNAGGFSSPPPCFWASCFSPRCFGTICSRTLRPGVDSSLAPPAFQACSLAHFAGFDLPKTCLWNLRLRGPTPYPLGQQTSWCSASSSYHRNTYANRAAEWQCIGCSGIAQACSLAHFAGFDLPRTRAWNLRLRGPTPYPQASRPVGALASSSYHSSAYANRAAERHCNGCSGIAQACSLAHFAGFDLPRTRAWNLQPATRPGAASGTDASSAMLSRKERQSD